MPHIHEKIDFTVDVFIVHQNKVLLRMHEKYGTLLAVGGHIELDEDPAHAAKRECMEEVGLAITLVGEDAIPESDEADFRHLPTPAGMNIHRVSPTHEHVSTVYFATVEHTDVTPEHPEDTWEWLTADELAARNDIRLNIKHYALQALEQLKS